MATTQATCRALCMTGPKQAAIIDVPVPKCGPLDAILRPRCLAPCTSDIHTVFDGAMAVGKNVILGHEGVGEVIEVGSLVKRIKVGDVCIIPAITPHWLSEEVQDGLHQHAGGVCNGWTFGVEGGTFSEKIRVNDADMNLYLLPEGVSLEQGAMASDMMTTGIQGSEYADIKTGSTVVVIACGPVGLMAVAGAKIHGAGRIIAVETRPVCIEAAKYYGATDIVDYTKGTVSEVMKLTNGKGVDAVIIAGGGSNVISDAVKITKPGATISNVNYFSGCESMPIPRLEWGMGMAHKTIKGGLTAGGSLRMERMANLIKYGRVDPSKLVTHRLYGFEKSLEALMMMHPDHKPANLLKPVVIIDYKDEKKQ